MNSKLCENRPLLISLLSLAILALSPLASAEKNDGGSTGGGNVVKTPTDEIRFLDLMKDPTREILDPRMSPGYDRLLKMFDSVSVFKTTTYIPREEFQSTTPVREKILNALDSLTFYLVPGPIPELDDKGLIILKKEFQGQILRLAVQSEKEKTVLVDRALFEQMSVKADDVAAFFAHESLIRVFFDNQDLSISSKRRGLVSTEAIGNLVRVVFDPVKARKVSERALVRYLADAGISAVQGFYDGYEANTKIRQPWNIGKEPLGELLIYLPQDQVIRKFSVIGGVTVSDTGKSCWTCDGLSGACKSVCDNDHYSKYTISLSEIINDREWPATIEIFGGNFDKTLRFTSKYKSFQVEESNEETGPESMIFLKKLDKNKR